jgi:hypothetical protein
MLGISNFFTPLGPFVSQFRLLRTDTHVQFAIIQLVSEAWHKSRCKYNSGERNVPYMQSYLWLNSTLLYFQKHLKNICISLLREMKWQISSKYTTKFGKQPPRKLVISLGALYVQVTVHRDKLRIKQPTRCLKYPKLYFSIKLYMFRAFFCPSSGFIYCTHGNWYVSCRVRLEGSSNLTLLGSGHITCIKHTNCRVYSR